MGTQGRFAPSVPKSRPLLQSPEWKINHQLLPPRERASLSYDRAKSIGLAYDITKDDLATLSKKFWDLHTDPITCVDGAATTLLTIQYNLAAGTITQFSEGRHDLDPVIDDLLKFRKIGQFMLTEVGHGLDVANLETTATRLPGGEFILTSPTPSSAKYMPPTIPTGLPTIAVVFARLLVEGEDYGVRPFVVPLNDGKQMCTGITARLLPYRELSCPVNHAITTFKNVLLPSSALLGPFEKSDYPHITFLHSIWRVAVGSIALSSMVVPGSKLHAVIGVLYSLRRMVGNGKEHVSLLHFRTQQIPVVTATAQSYIFDAFQRWAAKSFSDVEQDVRIRHGIAICFKAVAAQHAQSITLSISERCGAQGIQSFNMMTNMHAELRGIVIAEGDTLVLSIRLAIELLLDRYELPQSTNPSSLLARHESGQLEKYKDILRRASHHRSPEVNKSIFPHCLPIVQAIGHRMAYDAAVSAGVSPDLLDLYVASVIQLDPAWYSENMGLTTQMQEGMLAKALDAVLPRLEELIQGMDIDAYVSAPIVSDKAWDSFVDSLEVFKGDGFVPFSEKEAENSFLRARL